MKIATYNLWGLNEPWRYTVERGIARGAVPGSPATTLRVPGGLWPRRRQLLVEALRRVEPDLIGLQEVCLAPSIEGNSGGDSQAEQLARDLEYADVYPTASDADPKDGFVTHGLAVVSRYPIASTQILFFQNSESGTDRQQAALHATVAIASRTIDLIICHLALGDDAQLVATEQLWRFLDTLPSDHIPIVLGDFNAEPATPTIQALFAPRAAKTRSVRLCDSWSEAHPDDPGPTMPSQDPVSRLDYIFVGDGVEVVGAERLGDQPDADGFYPSDHLGVAATLRIG